MVNMNVEWAGPNFSLATLAKELTARFGAPARPYEFVTGYKSPANVSGHNADANGRGHSMDIFVGGGNSISVEQGIDLAERLRLEGQRGSIPGHPDRLAYIIHRGRIAGDHTNWEWVPYYGLADHYDHIHVSSVFDYFWGDPVAGNPLDYNSTLAWNLWQDDIQEDELAFTIDELLDTKISMADGSKRPIRTILAYMDANFASIAPAVWRTPVRRGGKNIPALQELADAKTLAGQSAAAIDYEKLATMVAGKLAGGIKITGSLEAKK